MKAVLKELESLLLDTERLKIRYKLTFQATSFSKAAASHPNVASADGILGVAISDEIRRDILFQAHLVQDRNSFPQRLRWATVDRSKFEEYIGQVRIFVQELWRLLDPLRQDEMASRLQLLLSHVIGMSQNLKSSTLSGIRWSIQMLLRAPPCRRLKTLPWLVQLELKQSE